MTGGIPISANSVKGFDALLRGAYQAHTACFRALIPHANLTISQFQVLYSIRALEPCSLSTVGQYLKLDPATTCGVVCRLKDRGLVTLRKDQKDHRRLILKIEPKGLRLLARTIPKAANLETITTRNLSAIEKSTLLKLLKKIGR